METRRSLSAREYDVLRAQADPSRNFIIKRRRCFLWQNKYFQIDVFLQPENASGLVLMEAYLNPNLEEIKAPSFIPVEAEITNLQNYALSALALKPRDPIC